MADQLLQTLKQYFGYSSFRPQQEDIIRTVLSGKDALVLMPTGGGKSICYQLPAMLLPGLTVVVSPLISLMKDQVEALRGNGIEAEAMNSVNDAHTNEVIRQRCEHGLIRLLYISPERLKMETEWLKGHVRVSLFAIDEAHCISQWGHDFRPEYAELSHLREDFADVPMMALTATADKITKADIVEQLHLREPAIFVSSFDRPNLRLRVLRGYDARGKLTVIMRVIGRHLQESGIVYCLSRKTTESVAAQLQQRGVKAMAYHAGLRTDVREQVQEDFINDRIQVVVATIAFGMGIDKSNVRFVIHYNLPKSIESYYQEIGRGGRDGLPTETILFYNIQDMITLRSFAEQSGQPEINLEKLKRMQEYAEAQVCRRRVLLNYFGEERDYDCRNCDVCSDPPLHVDGTIPVQKALSAIMRTGEKIGFKLCVDILRGAGTEEIYKREYNRLKTYGAGRDLSSAIWYDYLLQMLQMGFIEIDYKDDRHLKVTAQGREVLFGRRRAELAKADFQDRYAGRGKKKKAETKVSEATDTQGQLFKRLRALRAQIAQEEKVPAYIVFSDKTLHEMAAMRPTTLAQFALVPGVGEHKLETYGKRFIEVIRS